MPDWSRLREIKTKRFEKKCERKERNELQIQIQIFCQIANLSRFFFKIQTYNLDFPWNQKSVAKSLTFSWNHDIIDLEWIWGWEEGKQEEIRRGGCQSLLWRVSFELTLPWRNFASKRKLLLHCDFIFSWLCFLNFKIYDTLFDVTKQGYTSHCPMSWSNIALKINGTNVIQIGSSWFTVDGAFIELGVFTSSGVDGVDVNYRHLLIQNFGSGFHQFACLSV